MEVSYIHLTFGMEPWTNTIGCCLWWCNLFCFSHVTFLKGTIFASSQCPISSNSQNGAEPPESHHFTWPRPYHQFFQWCFGHRSSGTHWNTKVCICKYPHRILHELGVWDRKHQIRPEAVAPQCWEMSPFRPNVGVFSHNIQQKRLKAPGVFQVTFKSFKLWYEYIWLYTNIYVFIHTSG